MFRFVFLVGAASYKSNLRCWLPQGRVDLDLKHACWAAVIRSATLRVFASDLLTLVVSWFVWDLHRFQLVLIAFNYFESFVNDRPFSMVPNCLQLLVKMLLNDF